jgi:hypothetical protein
MNYRIILLKLQLVLLLGRLVVLAISHLRISLVLHRLGRLTLDLKGFAELGDSSQIHWKSSLEVGGGLVELFL